MPDVASAPASAAAPPADAKPQTLDDLMIAMDVVDTLRHRERLVDRELDEAGREAELIARLREIYRQQGIEVPDRVLAEGVKALKDSRFVYTPPPPGWKRTALTVWARRHSWSKLATVLVAAAGTGLGAHYLTVTRPAQQAEEQVRLEVTDVLPKAIRQAHADVLAIATEPAAKQRAGELMADGERAIRNRDRTGMMTAREGLRGLHEDVARAYTLTIVSRPGETSGVWRRPPGNTQLRNYYLIVEPIAADGKRLSIRVRNEENGRVESVDKFGVRVSKEVFDTVVRDKQDDGIIQRNKFAVKRRGMLSTEYEMPFEGGMITRW